MNNKKTKNRPYHRTTILTTTKKTFSELRKTPAGKKMIIQFANDIISSAAGGSSNQHPSIRRVSLLRRQASGGYVNVKVRWEKGNEIPCTIAGNIIGDIDGCSGKVKVAKVSNAVKA